MLWYACGNVTGVALLYVTQEDVAEDVAEVVVDVVGVVAEVAVAAGKDVVEVEEDSGQIAFDP